MPNKNGYVSSVAMARAAFSCCWKNHGHSGGRQGGSWTPLDRVSLYGKLYVDACLWKRPLFPSNSVRYLLMATIFHLAHADMTGRTRRACWMGTSSGWLSAMPSVGTRGTWFSFDLVCNGINLWSSLCAPCRSLHHVPRSVSDGRPWPAGAALPCSMHSRWRRPAAKSLSLYCRGDCF